MRKFSIFNILTIAIVSIHTPTSMATAHEAQLVKVRWTETNSSDIDEVVIKWLGVAASPNKRVLKVTNRRNEVGASSAAKSMCELASGRTCTAIAVPMSWDVVVLSCKHPGQAPVSIPGGSGQGLAVSVALAKANVAGFRPSDCIQVLYDQWER
jgi:hypothetical protein